MLLYGQGSPDHILRDEDLKIGLEEALKKLGRKKKVLIVPPDFTRFHSKAGILTQAAYAYYGSAVHDIMPALGTHSPMTKEQLEKIWEGKHDLILSIGQVVPHEVLGMANYNKNLFIGTGGSDAINFSHFVGAVYGMERMMGKAENPLRKILNYASDHFTKHLPIVYVQTVVSRQKDGSLATRGLFIGKDETCFLKAAQLSLKVNFTLMPKPLRRVVVFLNPEEFKSTWLGNKSIYRTRMAIADEGELIVLAPGVREFGEDPEIDALIRKFGYRTTPEVLQHLENSRDLMKNLSAAAHLIHGSSENRFKITYCPGNLSREEIESVGYKYADLKQMLAKYDPTKLVEGINKLPNGEEIYYISNPAIGLWACRDRFEGLPGTEVQAEETTASSTRFQQHADDAYACADASVGGGSFELKERSSPKRQKR